MDRMIANLLRLFLAAVAFLVSSPQSVATEPNVYVEASIPLVREAVTVNPGSYVFYKLPLTRGTTLVAEFKVEGGLNNTLDVWLLDLVNFQRFSRGQTFSYYRGTSGTIRDIGKYTFPIAQTNIYHLVLDNRQALLLPRNVRLYAYGVMPGPTGDSIQRQKAIGNLYEALRQLLSFPDFRIFVRHCGLENAFSDPDITICIELTESLGERGLPAAGTFVFFHELAHSLLRLWEYPLWDNEDVADELATVFMILFKLQQGALEAAQWWASHTSEQQAVAQLWVDDRHALSPQRARNIIRWLNQEEDLLRRWQKILVPNMQTRALVALDREGFRWIDHQLIRGELARRQVSAESERGSTD